MSMVEIFVINYKEINVLIKRQILFSTLDRCGFLHSQNIFHRDLKLENLLIDSESGVIKIADFGLSFVAEIPTELLKTKCGTPVYTAPEIFMLSKYSRQPPDIWSCEVMLYAIFAGRFPFVSSTIQNLIRKIVKGKVVYTDSMPLDAVDSLKHIFVVHPKKRYTLENIKNHQWFRKNYDLNHQLYDKSQELSSCNPSNSGPLGVSCNKLQKMLNSKPLNLY